MEKQNNDSFKFIGIVLLAGVLMYFILTIDFDFNTFSILPEFDNRITYADDTTQFTSFVQTSNGEFENNKWVCSGNGYNTQGYIQVSGCPTRGGGGSGTCRTQKDFSRLNTFITILSEGSGRETTFNIAGAGAITKVNYEIRPDNLNIGVYDVFQSGEFIKRVTIPEDKIFLRFIASGGDCFNRDWIYPVSIKYVPIETFTIKNDEVWVKEVRGSDYSIADLNWEMLGYHTQIRPATIRDLTAQTEVPAPQIYINLINGLPVNVAPNTIHTFFYKTKWTEGLDSSCQGDLDKVEVKIGDKWVCDSYVKETPIIQQCQTKSDCAILPECELQKDLINCNQETHLCDYTAFSPACKAQLITYQEKVTEIENTKFVPIPSGTNSFFCFFDKTSTSCRIGEKTLSASVPSYVCTLPSDSSASVSTGQNNDNCWQSTIYFDGNPYIFKNNEEKLNIGFNIKGQASLSGTIAEGKLRDSWAVVVKGTLPDNFLDFKIVNINEPFVLKDSVVPIAFSITNNLGFGIDGGYTMQTQNLALEGGVVLKNEVKELFLKNGENIVAYNFETSQFGKIADLIGSFGKVTTDREYIMKSSSSGNQKFLVIQKEVVAEIPKDIEKIQPIIIERKVSQDCRDYGCSTGFSCSKFNEGYVCKQENLFQRFIRFLKSLFGIGG